MTLSPIGRLMTTPEASDWLTARGLPRTTSTLEALRTRGGGMAPPFRKLGRAIRYAEADLEEWLGQIVSGPLRSTSEAA